MDLRNKAKGNCSIPLLNILSNAQSKIFQLVKYTDKFAICNRFIKIIPLAAYMHTTELILCMKSHMIQ